MRNSVEAVWITWEQQRRSIVLSKQFQAKLFIYDKEHKNRLVRYLLASFWTLIFIGKERPKVVFGQNPSMGLALLLCIFKPLFGYVLVVDRHSNFMFGVSDCFMKRVFTFVSNMTLKHADMTIVTNDYLRGHVEEKKGCGVVLEDKIPSFDSCTKISLQGKLNAVFVTSFSADEPIGEVIDVYSKLGDKISLYITGNYKKFADYERYSSPEYCNIVFTGYLSEEDYQNLLYSADIVICLTKNEHTLTCGAYEGLSLGKPMILSNTETIRAYFFKGAVYADPDRDSIMKSTLACIADYDQLRKDGIELKDELESAWDKRFTAIYNLIAGYARVE